MESQINLKSKRLKWNATDTHFSVVIYNANYEKGKEKGKEIVKQILKQITKNAEVTVAELAKILSTTEKTIRYHMDKLREEGIIERKGSTKTGKWIIK